MLCCAQAYDGEMEIQGYVDEGPDSASSSAHEDLPSTIPSVLTILERVHLPPSIPQNSSLQHRPIFLRLVRLKAVILWLSFDLGL